MPLVSYIDPGLILKHLGDDQNNTTLSTYTFSGLDFGAPHPTRRIVVGVRGRRDSGGQFTALIGGISADIHYNTSLGQGSTGMCSALVPTGETGTISITWPARAQVGTTISFYSVIGGKDSAPTLYGEDLVTTLTISPSFTEKQAIIAMAGVYSSSATWTWSGTLGVIEDSDQRTSNAISSSTASALVDSGGSIIATQSTATGADVLQVIGFK